MWSRIINCLVLLLFANFYACGKAGPVIPEIGKEHCSHCSMSIVDMRFHAQIQTSKGRRYYFDSIECLDHFQVQNKMDLKGAWVANYLNPPEMLPLDKALKIKSDKIRSPMGGGLAAFKSIAEANNFTSAQSQK